MAPTASDAWVSVRAVQLPKLPFHTPPPAVPRKTVCGAAPGTIARLVIRPDTPPNVETGCGGLPVQHTFAPLRGTGPSSDQLPVVRGFACGSCSGTWAAVRARLSGPSCCVSFFGRCFFGPWVPGLGAYGLGLLLSWRVSG